jgi:hypothetical protein
MFEQAIIRQQRRPWTVATSFTLQSAAVGAAVLLSIIHIDRLPGVQLPVPLPPLPAAPRAVEIVAAERMPSSAATSPRAVFTEPSRIPRSIAVIVDEVPAGPPSVPFGGLTGTGLPPGLYTGTPLFSSDQLRPPAPPPPLPAAPESTAPREPKMVRLGGNVLEAKLIRRVIPEYPKLARDMRTRESCGSPGSSAATAPCAS